MALPLTKGSSLNLSKADGTGLTRIFLGLGWDKVGAKPASAAKKGFLGGLFGGGSSAPASSSSGDSIDLDSSCIMFDANGRKTDVIWFRQRASQDGSIKHDGDNLTGEGDGDDEVIHVNLTKVPANVSSLVFVVSSFRGQTFNEVESAFCRVVDETNGAELARATLTDQGPYTAQIMARVYRTANGWSVQSIGKFANGRTVEDLVSAAAAVAL